MNLKKVRTAQANLPFSELTDRELRAGWDVGDDRVIHLIRSDGNAGRIDLTRGAAFLVDRVIVIGLNGDAAGGNAADFDAFAGGRENDDDDLAVASAESETLIK